MSGIRRTAFNVLNRHINSNRLLKQKPFNIRINFAKQHLIDYYCYYYFHGTCRKHLQIHSTLELGRAKSSQAKPSQA